MKYDVVALGELLVDFTQNGVSSQGNFLFEANPGGAPCNVLSILQSLGNKTAFIGKVGQDQFGRLLKGSIGKVGINSQNLVLDQQVHTTLAFVHTMEDGDRDFSFYRKPGADMMLKPEEIDQELINEGRIFHFGTLSMTDEPARSATKRAVEIAKEGKRTISFDPNLRRPLWADLEDAKEQILYGISVSDIVKLSEEELEFITGISDIEKGAAILRAKYPIKLLFITMGKLGSMVFCQDIVIHQKPFIQENTVDTTGAGDTFFGCILHKILENNDQEWCQETLQQALQFANAAAAIITTRKGALAVMPAMDEINALISQA